MMRQIAGSFAEYKKAKLAAKLKAARERKRLTMDKCEDRKSHAEIIPEMVQIANGLRRRKRAIPGAPSLPIWEPAATSMSRQCQRQRQRREYSAASVA
jgi:hypothetical protein